MTQAMQASMRERTGRDVDQWVRLVTDGGVDPLDQLAVRNWLRDVHGVPQNSQWAIAFAAAEAAGWVRPSAGEYSDTLFSGAKAALRPLRDAVLAMATAMGSDAEPRGRGTYTPVVRKRQFLAVAPGPRGTLRVGLRYRQAPADDRLTAAKGFAQATHWVHLEAGTDPGEIGWLEPLIAQAYEQNG